MKQEAARPRARFVAWLLVVGLIALSAGSAGLAAVVWERRGAELKSLRAQVEEQAVTSHLAEEKLAAVQATAAALDNRLAEIERAAKARLDATAAPAKGVPEAGVPGEWEEVTAAQAAVVARIDELEQQVAALTAAGAAEPARATPEVAPDAMPGDPVARTLPASVRLKVDAQKQRHNLSCESAAASMAARYHGVDVSEEDLLAALPRDDNPHLGFRGNVDGATGGTTDYGVYAAPVLAVLVRCGLDARMVEGGLAGIRAALARGNPVVAWVTYDCLAGTPVTVTVGGERVALVPYQHAVVVSGYDGGGVWANDPWDGSEDYYSVADFERAMGYFGQMAIEVAAPGD